MPAMNKDYTARFSEQFDETKVEAYHRKWFHQFEKNVKHRQQLDVIRKYLAPDTKWLDAPIGSGRVMGPLTCKDMTGFDNSPFFAEHNRRKGIKVVLGDLFDFPFRDEFDLITTLQTLANFSDFRTILTSLVGGLRSGGVLITDVVNRSHAEKVQAAGMPSDGNEGMSRAEIADFFSQHGCEVLECLPTDYYDSPFFMGRFPKPGLAYRLLNRAYFRLGLYPAFEWASRGHDESLYQKYLVVARKA